MKLFNLLPLLMAVLVMSCTKNKQTGFVIVVDEKTYNEVEAEIEEYSKSIEGEGIRTFIVVDEWYHPDSIRSVLKGLYQNENLEGTVFIGDIPIPMIRGAQHLATAFKMDEERYPFSRSSIPSDRFYDDFDLEFEFLKQDEKDSLLFYYKLLPDSPQTLSLDIYSARIKPNESENKHEKIRNYLKKVVAFKNNPEKVDQILFFSGHGYNSESMLARIDEKITLSQQFNYLASQQNLINYINYDFDTHVKFRLLAELKRKDLDLAFLHHHGGIEAQYLNGMPETSSNAVAIDNIKYYLRSKLRSAKRRGNDLVETKQYYHDWMGIPIDWFEGSFDDEKIKEDSLFNANLDIYLEDHSNYSSNARFIQFDACFNGSFQKDKYIASEYIFDEGNTITVQANSVNTLQDKWPGEMNGLLGLGLRIGFWHKMSCSIETHLFGDPTLSFMPSDNKIDVNSMINSRANDISYWEKQLNSPYPDVQALALRMIYNNSGKSNSSLYLRVFKQSPLNSVRTEAFKILSFCRDDNFIEAINLGINDSYEYIQRISASYILKTGDDSHIPYLIDALLQNNKGKRILYHLKDALGMYNPELLIAELDNQIGKKEYLLEPDITKDKVTKLINNGMQTIDRYMSDLKSSEATEKSQYNDIRLFRNKTAHVKLPELISFINNVESEKVKLAGIEMLGWFNYSSQRNEIIKFCEDILVDTSSSETLVQEATKTINRLK